MEVFAKLEEDMMIMKWIKMIDYVNEFNFNAPLIELKFRHDMSVPKYLSDFVLAGGYVNWYLSQHVNLYKNQIGGFVPVKPVLFNTDRPGDADFFCVGLTQEIMQTFREKYSYHRECERFIEGRSDVNNYSARVQLIKRDYTSIAEILNGFDISPSRAAYYKGSFYVTADWILSLTTNAFAMNYRCNGATVCARMWKYFMKGYKIIFPYAKNLLTDKIYVINHVVKVVVPYKFNHLYGISPKFVKRTIEYLTPRAMINIAKIRDVPFNQINFDEEVEKINKSISFSNEKIRNHFLQAITGRSAMDKNDPTMTVEMYVKSFGEPRNVRIYPTFMLKYFICNTGTTLYKIIGNEIHMKNFKNEYILHPVELSRHIYLWDERGNVVGHNINLRLYNLPDNWEKLTDWTLTDNEYLRVIQTIIMIWKFGKTHLSQLPESLLYKILDA